jgi:hypothetical protein
MSTPPIQIINTGGTTSFSPNPQTALVSDLVFWRNNTKEDHWPWPTDSNYNPLPTGWFPAPVPPNQTTGDFPTPTTAQTVYYCCKNHPTTERGTIDVVTSLPKL